MEHQWKKKIKKNKYQDIINKHPNLCKTKVCNKNRFKENMMLMICNEEGKKNVKTGKQDKKKQEKFNNPNHKNNWK